MPDFGDVNERRNQLHEVIRLSGMNIPISDNDHPLVVKVASMQPSRIQVYFIDNDDYFQKSGDDVDSFGTNRIDNDERAIFFAHGTLETAKKLRWDPGVLHVSGWMCGLVPLYMRRLYSDTPGFRKTKIVYTIHAGARPESIDAEIFEKLKAEGLKPGDLKKIKEFAVDEKLLDRLGIFYSDAVVFHGVEADPELLAFAEANGVKTLQLDGESDHADEYDLLYESL